MSAFPPVEPSRANHEGEVARADKRELEAKAARYSRLHPDGEPEPRTDNVVRRALRRARAVISRRR